MTGLDLDCRQRQSRLEHPRKCQERYRPGEIDSYFPDQLGLGLGRLSLESLIDKG